MSEPRERTYSSGDGLSLFFRDWDESGRATAVPVLCLAGLTRNSKDFHRLARRLAPNRRVICLDLRGRGRSAYDTDWRNYHPRVYLEDLRHLLAALGIARVIVIGTSLGGLLGMAMATAMPGALAGLVLNDVGPDVDLDGLARIYGYISRDHPQPDWPSAVAFLRAKLPRLSPKTGAEWLEFAQNTFHPGTDGRLHYDWDVAIARPLARGLDREYDLWQLWRALARTPTLAIRGQASDILSSETFARMKATKPDLLQATLPAVGHAPTLDEPPLREVVDDFVRRL